MSNQDFIASFFVNLRPGAAVRAIFGGTPNREIVWKGGSQPFLTIVSVRKDRTPAATLERATRAAILEFWVNMLNAIRPDGKRSGLFRSETVIQNAAAQIALSYGLTLLPPFIKLRIRLLEETDLAPAREAYAVPASRIVGQTPRISALLYTANQAIRQAARR